MGKGKKENKTKGASHTGGETNWKWKGTNFKKKKPERKSAGKTSGAEKAYFWGEKKRQGGALKGRGNPREKKHGGAPKNFTREKKRDPGAPKEEKKKPRVKRGGGV